MLGLAALEQDKTASSLAVQFRFSKLLAAVATAHDKLTDLTSVVQVALARIQDSES